MAAWDARRPWRLVPEIHDQGGKHFFRIRLLEPIPVDWAVILGETLHDLMSALDQAVYWLTVDWTRQPLAGSAFPIYTRRAKFCEWSRRANAWSFTSGMNKIRGVGPGPQTFIEALQPYPQRYRRFYCRDLRTVHDLWNQDKHRLVHLWGLRFRQPQLRLPAHIHPDCVVHHDWRVLHEGAIPIKLICDPPHPKVQMKGEIGADLTFSSGKRRSGARSELLWDTTGTVMDVVRKLTGAIGRQTVPINLTVWTAKRWPTHT
jgi:hypothetical protein